MLKTYTELMSLQTFEERYEYLQQGITHQVGDSTFGSMRYTNQALYRSRLWKLIRAKIITRDNGCDLAIPDRPILVTSLIRIHHINPLTPEMFDVDDPLAYDSENLICIHDVTHRLLSYGGTAPKKQTVIERSPYDHLPWRKE